MADLSDVTAYLAQATAAAVYPNGASQPSIAVLDCRIYEGWPLPDKLDRDMAGLTDDNPPQPRANGVVPNVSVFPMPGTGVSVYQILDETYVISPAAIASAFEVSGNTITVSGQIAAGEFLTLVIDDAAVCSQSGANAAAMLAALAAEAQSKGYAASATSTTLTVSAGHSLVVRQGGRAVMGKVTHRQRQSVMVTVWAPTHALRTTLAAAIDNWIKRANKVAMPDTSQAVVTYSRTNVIDEQQSATIYRRDLIYDVEYATVEQFPGYTITSTQVSIAKPGNAAIATALT